MKGKRDQGSCGADTNSHPVPKFNAKPDVSEPTIMDLVQGFWETGMGSEVFVSGNKATWTKSGHTATIVKVNATTAEMSFDDDDSTDRIWQGTLVLCEDGSPNLLWTDGDRWKKSRPSSAPAVTGRMINDDMNDQGARRAMTPPGISLTGCQGLSPLHPANASFRLAQRYQLQQPDIGNAQCTSELTASGRQNPHLRETETQSSGDTNIDALSMQRMCKNQIKSKPNRSLTGQVCSESARSFSSSAEPLADCTKTSLYRTATPYQTKVTRRMRESNIENLQGAWIYQGRVVAKGPVKVVIEGDTATWPDGHEAKISVAENEFVLQFEGQSLVNHTTKYYAALRPEDGALCWSDGAIWTRVSASEH